jgi:YqaJ-like viral recombinase domain
MPIETIPITSREQWLNLRKGFVTASNVPAVCNVSGYDQTPLSVYLEKQELARPIEENALMRRGRWMEPAVFAALAERFPNWQIQPGKVFIADHDARLGATPDGIAVDPERPGIGVIQCKVISRPVFKLKWLDDPGSDNDETAPAHVPLDYMLQTITEAMLVDGASPKLPPAWAAVATLVLDTFGAFLRVFPVDRHPSAEATIRKAVADWWVLADQKIMPPVDPTRDSDTLKALYPQDDGTEIDLSANIAAQKLVDSRREWKIVAKQAKTNCETIDTSIKALLGPHTYGRVADGSLISWKTQEVSGYVVKPRTQRALTIRDPK